MSVYSMPHCLAPGNFLFPDIIFICTLLLPLEFSFLSYRCKFFVPSFRDLCLRVPPLPSLLLTGGQGVSADSGPVLVSRQRMTLPPTSQSLRAPGHSSLLTRAGARCRVPGRRRACALAPPARDQSRDSLPPTRRALSPSSELIY